MRRSKVFRTLAVTVALQCVVGLAGADDGAKRITIKKWKADPVDLYDRPNGRVVERRAAAKMAATAAETGGELGWLKVHEGGKDYYVEASQVRTDLKLSGPRKCDKLGSATGVAASRGYGEEDCIP
jgi:hypothetical protein